MQKSTLLAAAASAALLVLPACDNSPQTVNGLPDAQADALRNAAPVQLPPSVISSKQYRCSDNSLYIVDFYNNDTATIRTSQGGTPTPLTGQDADGPYAGTGYTLSGNGNNVTVNGKSCHT